MTTMKEIIPSKVIKRSNNLPFLSKDLMAAVRKKAQLFKRAKHVGTDRAWQKYNNVRNRVTSALRAAKTTYFNELSAKLKSPKDFWAAYHKLAQKRDRISVNLVHDNITGVKGLFCTGVTTICPVDARELPWMVQPPALLM